MTSSRMTACRLTVAGAAVSTLLAIGLPLATAAPATDDHGFVDSTARCTAPDVAVAFGDTATSRVAICKSAGGLYEYRGVRVTDGAKLVVDAKQSGDGAYTAENNGVTYTVTSSALVVSAGSRVIRDEPMVNFHGQTTSPTPKQAAPTAAATPTKTTPPTPLPPPLPAEVGGS
ncbi:hypothetical protein [Mycobacterium sp. URHB0021]